MSDTATPITVSGAADPPRPPQPGDVLVADRLVRAHGPDIPCPAAELVAAELRRRGARPLRGALPLAPPRAVGTPSRGGPATAASSDAVRATRPHDGGSPRDGDGAAGGGSRGADHGGMGDASRGVGRGVAGGGNGRDGAEFSGDGSEVTGDASRGAGHGVADDGGITAVIPSADPPIGLGAARIAGAADPVAERAVRDSLEAWLGVADVARTVLLAAPRSFCAGVERAIEVVEQALEQRGSPVYVRKQIVHNTHVVADLESRGAIFVDELDAVPAGATVVFSAHGVSPQVHRQAAERDLRVIDATCPLVTKVHTEARRFATRGDTVVLIGHAGHEEVEGTLGEAPERTVLVETPEDVAALEVEDPDRVSYLTQTTLAVDETAAVVDALRARFPALRGPASDDICYATTNRQDALHAIAEESDLVLVVGSDNSSNSVRLVELAERRGTPAHLIDDTGGIRPEWLAGVHTIGLTAGASAPPGLVESVIAALGGLGPVTVQEREVTRETIHFTLPSVVRRS